MSIAKVVQHPAARRFKAAKATGLTSDWPINTVPIDWDIRQGLQQLRARSRTSAQNDDLSKHYLRLLKTHVAGPNGITYQCKAMTGKRPATALRSAVESGWRDWGTLGTCDVSGEHSWRSIQHLALESTARDGEVLVRRLLGWEGNRYRYALQLIDAETLDITYSDKLPNGNVVLMGVEMDAWRRRQAYWLLPSDPELYSYGYRYGDRFRVPASEIIHLYVPEWIWQTRGVPWMHTAMLRLHHCARYEEAAVVAARGGASKMGIITQDSEAQDFHDTGTGEPQAGALGDRVASTGALIEHVEPGTTPVLPPGYTWNSYDPSFPNANHGSFLKPVYRNIASGLGVDYCTLANDLEGVTYSSLRQGALNDRDHWMTLQTWLMERLHDIVHSDWLKQAVSANAIVVGGRPLQVDRIGQLWDARSWTPRRWQWVDPLKDGQAAALAVAMGTRSLTSIIRERGEDEDDVWQEIANERTRLAELGISIQLTTSSPSAASGGAGSASAGDGSQTTSGDGGTEA